MNVLSEKPTFYGSWKGRVLEAIVVDRAQTWEDLAELTSLYPNQLNAVLKELFSIGAS
jgi:hypothetical protein